MNLVNEPRIMRLFLILDEDEEPLALVETDSPSKASKLYSKRMNQDQDYEVDRTSSLTVTDLTEVPRLFLDNDTGLIRERNEGETNETNQS
jgi:hypothetical protein